MALPSEPPTGAALTRQMAIFLLLNAFVLSGVLWLAAPSGVIGSPPVGLASGDTPTVSTATPMPGWRVRLGVQCDTFTPLPPSKLEWPAASPPG